MSVLNNLNNSILRSNLGDYSPPIERLKGLKTLSLQAMLPLSGYTWSPGSLTSDAYETEGTTAKLSVRCSRNISQPGGGGGCWRHFVDLERADEVYIQMLLGPMTKCLFLIFTCKSKQSRFMIWQDWLKKKRKLSPNHWQLNANNNWMMGKWLKMIVDVLTCQNTSWLDLTSYFLLPYFWNSISAINIITGIKYSKKCFFPVMQ